MAQRRFWNYLDDDLTVDLTRWITGLMPSGLYRGFDWVPGAGLNLVLNHESTGYKYVDKDQNETSFLGIVITRQGVIVQDDSEITIPISENISGNPRIDLIILSHEYEEFEGGSDALYSVIEGTPGANPVEPSVPDNKKDVVIGALYLPNGTTSLDGAGITFTRRDVPVLAENSNIPLKNKVNTFTKSQQIKSDSGIRIKEFEYTNGGTYTKQIIEIDPTTNSYILDLDDADQIGTYDPTSDSVALMIKPSSGFDNDLSGFTATIRLKGSSGKRLKFIPTSPDPEPLSGDGVYTLANVHNILSANDSVDTIPYSLTYDTTDREHLFVIHFDGNQNFIFDPGTLSKEKQIDNSLVDSSIMGMLQKYISGDLIIISGCVISATIPGTSTITEGSIFYNNKLYKVPAGSVVTTSGQTLVFESNQDRTIELQAGASGSGIANYNASVVKRIARRTGSITASFSSTTNLTSPDGTISALRIGSKVDIDISLKGELTTGGCQFIINVEDDYKIESDMFTSGGVLSFEYDSGSGDLSNTIWFFPYDFGGISVNGSNQIVVSIGSDTNIPTGATVKVNGRISGLVKN